MNNVIVILKPIFLVISTNTLVKILRTVVFSILAIRLATATLAQLTAGPRNKGHLATKIRAPEVPFTPTPPDQKLALPHPRVRRLLWNVRCPYLSALVRGSAASGAAVALLPTP